MTQTAYPVPNTKIPCYAFASNTDVARHLAGWIAGTIRQQNSIGRRAVLGLITGSTPVAIYSELVRLHREEDLDFSQVVAFAVYEYFGLGPDRLQSHRRWLQQNFFDQVNIPAENVHFLDGTVPAEGVEGHCRLYDEAIRRAGGMDIVLLGIGRNGRIGYNEPFSVRNSRTRLAALDPITRRDAASEFFNEDYVPTHGLTMGIGTILEARKIVLVAFGEDKAHIVRDAAEGPVTDRVPASFLRDHPDASFLLDDAAAAELTGIATPWILGNVAWTDPLVKRAVLWLCQQTQKALLKLEDRDFRDHNLHQLLRHHGPAQKLAQRVFDWMMATIGHHPAGLEPKKKIICFSPHPDDDVISMGGTLIRLVEDRHEVHVAYMTSGNIAVFDHDARRLADLLAELNRRFEIDVSKTPDLETHVLRALASKAPGDADVPAVQKIKELIRWSEAKAAAFVCGLKEEHLHFLDLPFYRTGTVAKRPAGPEDVRIIRELLESVAPDQIYVAGDLSDPHGPHRVCAQVIFDALREIEAARGSRPEVLLYRGAWEEWAPHVIEIAVPLSPRDLELKKASIFRHESQKDAVLFPGPDDPREFWQRAEDRNKHTAAVYNQFGLPEYYALEAFVRWKGELV